MITSSPALRYAKSLHSYNPIPRGCVLYLPLWNQNLSGSVFKSIDSYGHICTITGATYGSTGRTFDGTDDLISVANHASLNPADAISLEVWFNATSISAYDVLAMKADDVSWNPGWGILFFPADNIQFFVEWNTEFATKAFTFATSINEWHHVVGTYDRTTVNIYVDGVVGTPASREEVIDAPSSPFEIGRGADNTYNLYGNIGEVRVYNRALSQSEVTYIYNQTKWRYS
uniref:Putative lectin/glucanase superfamily protein n=1 Tax=viral metagenome TaxID=1070528 RepID=A0A6M3J392_9ZZZZ